MVPGVLFRFLTIPRSTSLPARLPILLFFVFFCLAKILILFLLVLFILLLFILFTFAEELYLLEQLQLHLNSF